MKKENKIKNGHTTIIYVNGVPKEKEKIPYDSDKEAIEQARLMNSRTETIRKVIAYKCPICHKWHVGRSRRVLTEKDREHYRIVLVNV